jgi:hypothetical protein
MDQSAFVFAIGHTAMLVQILHAAMPHDFQSRECAVNNG